MLNTVALLVIPTVVGVQRLGVETVNSNYGDALSDCNRRFCFREI